MKKMKFNLTEMISLMAIACVLLTLAIPFFSQAQEEAMKTNCTANLQKSMQCVNAYAESHDQKVLLATAKQHCWVRNVYSDVGNVEAIKNGFTCPDFNPSDWYSRTYGFFFAGNDLPYVKKHGSPSIIENNNKIVDMNKIIEKLPNPSCVLIHSNYKGDIVELVKDISKENECRFVVSCKGLESTYRLLEFMTKNGFEDVEMKQVNISGSSDITNGLNMEVRENSFIVKGKGKIF